MSRQGIKQMAEQAMVDAVLRCASSVPTVVDVAMRCAQGAREIVDVGCGAQAYVGYRLLTAGYAGPVRFVDWNVDAVLANQEVLRAIASADNTPIPSSWRWDRASVQALTLNNAVLLIQGTLPRRLERGELVKPNAAPEITTMLRSLQRTQARTAILQITPSQRDAVIEGARRGGMRATQIEPVAWAQWSPERDAADCTLVIDL